MGKAGDYRIFQAQQAQHGFVVSRIGDLLKLKQAHAKDEVSYFIAVQIISEPAPSHRSEFASLVLALLDLGDGPTQRVNAMMIDRTSISPLEVVSAGRIVSVVVFTDDIHNADVDAIASELQTAARQYLHIKPQADLAEAFQQGLPAASRRFLESSHNELRQRIVSESNAPLDDEFLRRLLLAKSAANDRLGRATECADTVVEKILLDHLRFLETELQAATLRLLYQASLASAEEAVRHNDKMGAERENEARLSSQRARRDSLLAAWTIVLVLPVLWVGFWSTKIAPSNVSWWIVVIGIIVAVALPMFAVVRYHRNNDE